VALSTHALAGELSVAARADTEDPRRSLFEIHVELVGRLSPAWAARLRAEYCEVLKGAPFDDNALPPYTFPTMPGGFQRVISSE
jgi:hypothetical protein